MIFFKTCNVVEKCVFFKITRYYEMNLCANLHLLKKSN